ncbi:MAG: hypothetical protein KAH93_02645 [Candidatus Aenigmarchaeota archaeon]|nr:hypothetical protein [Candidatus Aenigmarchaeota archaeon]
MNNFKTDRKTVRLCPSQIIYLECLKDSGRFESDSGAIRPFVEQYLGHEKSLNYKDPTGTDSPSNGLKISFRIEGDLLGRAENSSKKYHNNNFSLFVRSAVAYDTELHESNLTIDYF